MHKFALDTPTLTDPAHMVSYDCLGSYSSFIDTAAASIGTYSDMLTYFDRNPEDMWMIGWGKVSHHSENSSKFLQSS